MKRKKVRKESGRRYNKLYDPEEGLYYEIYWDDWVDYRDGQRDINRDRTKKQPPHLLKEKWFWLTDKRTRINNKIIKLLNRRRLMRKRK